MGISGDLTVRWQHWALSMCFFLWVVYTLLIGLADATNSEEDPEVRDLIANVKIVTCVSWCTYPIVYLFPMLHIGGTKAVISVQIGYCASDVISKWCGFDDLPDHHRQVQQREGQDVNCYMIACS